MAKYRDQLDRSCDDFDSAIRVLVARLSFRRKLSVMAVFDQPFSSRTAWSVLASIPRVAEFVERHTEVCARRILASLTDEIEAQARDLGRLILALDPQFLASTSRENRGRTSTPTLPGVKVGQARPRTPISAPKAPWEASR